MTASPTRATRTQITRIQEFAEHVARAEPPYVSFRQVEARTRLPPPRPAFLFGPISSFLARQMYAQTELRPTGCYILRDAAAGPTEVAFKDDVAFASDSLNHHRPYVQTVVPRLNSGNLPVRYVDGPLVVLLGPSYEVYGHFLIDYMPRLWLLDACGFDIGTLKFLVPMKPPRWTLNILQAAGLRPDQFVPYLFGNEVVRTDLLIVPTILRTYERLSKGFADATRFWTDRIRSGMPPANGTEQRVFVSRGGGTSGRRLLNRQEVEDYAARQGFMVVRPETASLAEQVALFGAARQIIGEYGSGLHNSIFAQPGAITCALRGTDRDPGSIQSSLAEAFDQEVGYVFGATEGSDAEQSMTIDLEDVRRAVETMSLSSAR